MPWNARLPRDDDFTLDRAVHDGDTLWLECDLGDWLRKVRDCRLMGVRAPERVPPQPGWEETRRFVLDWVHTWNVGPWPFRVDTYRTSTYRDAKTIDRFLSMVYNRDRSSCLNLAVQAFVDVNQFPPGR